MAITGTPPLKLRLFSRVDVLDPGPPRPYVLTQVSFAGIDFFAPHNAPRDRRKNLPSVDLDTGLVTAKTPGVYLFQVRAGDHYLVGRLQVHNKIVGWWFGNDSITTAVDGTIFHAQPSIYARFEDDPATGTDLVGDITGHGYFLLTSSDQTKFVTNADGRLRGVAETADSPAPLPQVSGTFLNQNNKLTVRVVDYSKTRTGLTPLFAPNVAHANDTHNVVFLAEGFLQGDAALFEDVVAVEVTEDLFHKPRHQPFAMLNGSFNVFQTFAPSQQEAVTCGFRVTDTAVGPIPVGTPIPYENRISANHDLYTVKELVTRVGLPMRREQRQDLKRIWSEQDLHDFIPAKVDDALIDTWKAQQSEGILHARDTFFGLHLGRRLADRPSGAGPVPPPPNGDTAGDAGLQKFIARVYEFYQTPLTRVLTPDPRRHPPELQAPGVTNPLTSIMRFLAGLQYRFAPNYPVGQTWVPDDTQFKPSRGLVAIIAFDDIIGGNGLNNGTLTALTVNSKPSLSFVYADSPTKLEMRRTPAVEALVDQLTDTIAHEFGHSFNLGDEYEEIDGDDPDGPKVNEDVTFDNLTVLNFIRAGRPDSRNIDPNRVKWLHLPRARLSDRLVVASTAVAGGIVVTIDPRLIGKWVRAKADQDSTQFADVSLRNANVTPTGQQLPLQVTTDQILTGLTILQIDETLGTILLSSPGLPLPIPTFAKGSSVFLPLRDKNGQPVRMADSRVLNFLEGNHTPLNLDLDAVHVSRNVDQPVDIPGIGMPRLSPRLVGVYEGANLFAGGYYRPTGECKMRNNAGVNDAGEFCFVCKWLIVNRVDPGYHSIISARFYPEATDG